MYRIHVLFPVTFDVHCAVIIIKVLIELLAAALVKFLSSTRAGKEDFVGGGLNVTFDPSSPSVGGGGASGSPLGEVVVEIGVVDDEINEADEGFLVAIELISHAHKSFVNLSHRSLVLVKIVDNDRKNGNNNNY